MEAPLQRKRARRIRFKPPSEGGFLGANYGTISTQARSLFETGWFFMVVLTGIGALMLYSSAPRLTTSFLVITVPALIGVRLWTKEKYIGLPIFPIFLVQQAVVYSLPVFAYSEDIPPEYEDIFFLSAGLTGVFFLFVYWAWKFTVSRVKTKSSKLNLSLGEGVESDSKCLNLAFGLLAASLVYHIVWRTGLWDMFLAGALGGLISVIRTFSSAAAMLGALLGGIVIGKIPTMSRRIMFWGLIISLATISLIDVLLSDASRVVLAAVVGMSLGKGKPPWALLIITFSIVGFLNQGKVDIRERYWEQGSNSTGLSLTELPSFFTDWIKTSARLVGGGKKKEAETQEEGASVFKRINNLQNTLFVVDAIRHKELPILNGETYTLIPPLFIPRAFWPGKPRAHKGQAILNVHFGRQKNEEETHRVYIAWGILPEAIGNFGVWMGPIFLGIVMGVAIGFLERVSMKKRILSVEGLTLGGLLLITAGSYEMVASVLLTSTFQFLVAVSVAGFGLFIIFRGSTKDEEEQPGRAPKKRAVQIGHQAPPPTGAMMPPPAPGPIMTQPDIPHPQPAVPTSMLPQSQVIPPPTGHPQITEPQQSEPPPHDTDYS